MGIGRVTQVMGPVIDVRFEHNEVPEINNALIVEIPKSDTTISLTLEVALQVTMLYVLLQWIQLMVFNVWKFKTQVKTSVYLLEMKH